MYIYFYFLMSQTMGNKTEYRFCYKCAVFIHYFKKGLTFEELLEELPHILRIDNDVIVQYLDNDEVLMVVTDNEHFRYVIDGVFRDNPTKRFYIHDKPKSKGNESLQKLLQRVDELEKKIKH